MIKKVLYAGLIIEFLTLFTSCDKQKNKYELKNRIDSISYSLALNIGENLLKRDFDTLSPEALAKGFEDVILKNPYLIDMKETETIINKYILEKRMKESEKSLEAEKKFFENNKNNPKIITTSSGLQYEIIKEGTGPVPNDSSIVKVHYRGTFIDGKVFDSSYERNEPIEFKINQVIQGWKEGLKLMKKGSKYKLYIPSALGYGPQGYGNAIPPNTPLIFEVELLDILSEKK